MFKGLEPGFEQSRQVQSHLACVAPPGEGTTGYACPVGARLPTKPNLVTKMLILVKSTWPVWPQVSLGLAADGQALLAEYLPEAFAPTQSDVAQASVFFRQDAPSKG